MPAPPWNPDPPLATTATRPLPPPKAAGPKMRRRTEDTATYTFEWTLLLVAILTWASSSLVELASYATWGDLMQPKVMLTQLGQLCGTILAVTAAKRIK